MLASVRPHLPITVLPQLSSTLLFCPIVAVLVERCTAISRDSYTLSDFQVDFDM